MVETLREPGVVLQLRHALSAGAGTSGEERVRQAERKLEEVNRGVAQSVAEQDGGEGGRAEEQREGPHFPPLHHGHGVPDQRAWKGCRAFQERMGVVSLRMLPARWDVVLPALLKQELSPTAAMLIRRGQKQLHPLIIYLESQHKIWGNR